MYSKGEEGKESSFLHPTPGKQNLSTDLKASLQGERMLKSHSPWKGTGRSPSPHPTSLHPDNAVNSAPSANINTNKLLQHGNEAESQRGAKICFLTWLHLTAHQPQPHSPIPSELSCGSQQIFKWGLRSQRHWTSTMVSVHTCGEKQHWSKAWASWEAPPHALPTLLLQLILHKLTPRCEPSCTPFAA